MSYIYLGLAFVGAVAPYSFMGQFLLSHGLNFSELKDQLWATPISSFVATAFFISTFVTFFFVLREGRRRKIKGLWLPLLGTVLVGVSCGLPLFLYLNDIAKGGGSGAPESAEAGPPALRR